MSSEKTVKATIETSSGIKIVIESDRTTVQDVVAEIHRREENRARFRQEFLHRSNVDREKFRKMIKSRNILAHDKTAEKSGPKTKSDIISDLIKNGFFKEPKTITDVQKILQEKGYHYPLSSLSPTLLRFLRKELLLRFRNKNGIWSYKSG